MNKQKLVAALIEQLEADLIGLKEAARATYEAATHEESKPENEYDTRALESSYLAGAQAKRAAEIDEVLSQFKFLDFKPLGPTDPVSATALVELNSEGKSSFVLVMPKGGGVSLSFEGQTVQVITPHSVLGESLLGLKKGDVAEVEVGEKVREYEIRGVQ